MSGESKNLHTGDRTAAPAVHGVDKSAEIRRLQKMARDLAIGMANLRALRPVPYDFAKRELAHAAKMRSVETKLFRLRQLRLL
jgi:hypothetical protein